MEHLLLGTVEEEGIDLCPDRDQAHTVELMTSLGAVHCKVTSMAVLRASSAMKSCICDQF